MVAWETKAKLFDLNKKAAAMKQVQLAYSAKGCKKLLEETLQNK